MVNEEQNKKTILALIAAVILLSGALGLALIDENTATVEEPKREEPAPFTSTTMSADEMASWKTYESSRYGFSFKYPEEYSVESQDPYYERGQNYPLHVVRVKPPRNATSAYMLELVVPAAKDEYYLPMTGFGSRIYRRLGNRWVEQNPRTGQSHAVCVEQVTLGSQQLPAYRSIYETSGFVSDIALVITKDNFIKLTIEHLASSTPDTTIEKIVSSFSLSDAAQAVTAQCDPNQPAGTLEQQFEAPYPMTWKEGSAEFAVTGVGLGTVPAPEGLLKFGGGLYEPGQEVHVLALSVQVKAEQDNPCVPLNMRRLINEAGDLVAPNTPQFHFGETDGCAVEAGKTYEYQVMFEVPNTEKEFLITTGGRSNAFFQVAERDGVLMIENASKLEG